MLGWRQDQGPRDLGTYGDGDGIHEGRKPGAGEEPYTSTLLGHPSFSLPLETFQLS